MLRLVAWDCLFLFVAFLGRDLKLFAATAVNALVYCVSNP